MASLEQLTDIFGERAKGLHRYLKNKRQGGDNNAKGNTYENYYAIYLIAIAGKDNIEDVGTSFSAQTESFVDDLHIETTDKDIFCQIKDIQTLSWTAGDHSLVEDFKIQLEIGNFSGRETECRIVVSRTEVYEALKNSVPEGFSDSSVEHFSTSPTVNHLLSNNEKFRNAIADICALKKPGLDKLSSIAALLIAAWESGDKNKKSVKGLFDLCYKINPNYIIGFENKLPDDLEKLLNTIADLEFGIENSYIVWKYRDTDEGVIPYPIGSKEFAQWENDLKNSDPQTFSELEPFLS